MAKQKETKPKRNLAASTPEAQENRCIALAMNLAEQQLLDGTASAQVISHFLREGSTRQMLEKDRIAKDVVLLEAKADSIKSAKKVEELYADAIAAMKKYRGEDRHQNDEML